MINSKGEFCFDAVALPLYLIYLIYPLYLIEKEIHRQSANTRPCLWISNLVCGFQNERALTALPIHILPSSLNLRA